MQINQRKDKNEEHGDEKDQRGRGLQAPGKRKQRSKWLNIDLRLGCSLYDLHVIIQL